jgi:tungstate transport system permease protein
MESFGKALELIVLGDPTLIGITLRSVSISGFATIFASCWSIPIGAFLGLGNFKGRSLLKGIFNILIGLPTVTLGLILYLIFSHSGPLGFLHILYTPTAIIIGQAILITPIIVSFVSNTLESIDPEIKNLALTLGASELRANLTMLNESLSGIVLAVIASFNRAIAELGLALMLGGNIRGATRVFTTVIALETNRGEIILGLALAVILLGIVGIVNVIINWAERLV